ncbi:TetR/AcrR family transcriptional regulator [Paraliomyxa miuraensis]|uniref:TetR/AcrR family transcriptional regulator n=1 Tax=Paraliomyxa miuraensis TaxID=376150 RepID=UPI00225A7616|nr:TetR/AcrR family transcriptional regulator [Paraliomyxa miuraensis]MCX4244706.1 TetR family transcriptional regulator [Paraliomyxa miuraensis]
MSEPSPTALEVEEPRTRRIVEVALRLAEAGGLPAVRLRDVADQAGVALRTLYKRFPSKDDLLFAVLVHELVRLEQQLCEQPVHGPTPVIRLRRLFEVLTAFLCERPNLGRAIVSALAGGSTTLPRQVSAFHDRINALVIDALAGDGRSAPRNPTHPRQRLGAMLQHVWFSALVAWSNEVHEPEEIVEAVIDAASLVLEPPDGL